MKTKKISEFTFLVELTPSELLMIDLMAAAVKKTVEIVLNDLLSFGLAISTFLALPEKKNGT